MRVFTWIVLAAFAMSTVDIPLSVLNRPAITCCGRKICTCTHAKGANCPIKKALKKQEEQKAPFGLKQAPCHSSAPKAAVPGHFRDFEITSSILPAVTPHVEFLPQPRILTLATNLPRGLERPPRFVSSF